MNDVLSQSREVVTKVQKGECPDLAPRELFEALLSVQSCSPRSPEPEEGKERIWRGRWKESFKNVNQRMSYPAQDPGMCACFILQWDVLFLLLVSIWRE